MGRLGPPKREHAQRHDAALAIPVSPGCPITRLVEPLKGTSLSSLLTNTSAMVALQTLRNINSKLDETNKHVSTGLRVNSAADNAAYWSIATTIRSDNGALGAVQDALGVGKSTVDTVSTGLSTVQDALQKIKEKLVSASAPNVDRGKLQTEINDLLSQLKSDANNTVSVGGDNWLSVDSSTAGYNASKTVVVSFSRQGQLGLRRYDRHRHLGGEALRRQPDRPYRRRCGGRHRQDQLRQPGQRRRWRLRRRRHQRRGPGDPRHRQLDVHELDRRRGCHLRSERQGCRRDHREEYGLRCRQYGPERRLWRRHRHQRRRPVSRRPGRGRDRLLRSHQWWVPGRGDAEQRLHHRDQHEGRRLRGRRGDAQDVLRGGCRDLQRRRGCRGWRQARHPRQDPHRREPFDRPGRCDFGRQYRHLERSPAAARTWRRSATTCRSSTMP